MDNSESMKRPGGPGGIKRRTISLSTEQLVREEFLPHCGCLPLLVQPLVEGLRLVEWAGTVRDQIEQKLLRYGAILFRGFKVEGVESFEEVMKAFAGDLLDYSYRSTPRTQVSGKIYSSTEYPAHQTIPQHNEMAYSRQWPMVLGFFCVQPAVEGGETPLADSRQVFARIDPAVRERFNERQVSYVRNYGEGLDLTWENVFQTDERAEAEAFCRRNGIEFEWKSTDRLRTVQRCQSIARHPKTGEMVWFNQAHLFHVSSLEAEIRDLLLTSGDEPPRNAYFGDGSPISDADLESVRAAYEAETIAFLWQKGDVLIVDNMLVAHGRRPFSGARKIVVGMGQLHGSSEKD